MATIRISNTDLDAMARTARSEVGHFGKYGEATLRGGVEAVVDTIVNRVAHPGHPNTVSGVVNKAYQFSAIGGPGGVKTWENLRPAPARITSIVERHVSDRARGKPCTVEGAAHFLNPYYASARSLEQWGNHVVRTAVKVWGQGRDVHYHGFAPDAKPPPPYTFVYGGLSCDFDGRGVPRDLRIAEQWLAPFDLELADSGLDYAAEAEPFAPAYETTLAGDSASLPMEYGMTMSALSREAPVFAPFDDVVERPPAYKVERITGETLDGLQDTLNSLAAQGWRLRQIVPHGKNHLLVLDAPGAVTEMTKAAEAPKSKTKPPGTRQRSKKKAPSKPVEA